MYWPVSIITLVAYFFVFPHVSNQRNQFIAVDSPAIKVLMTQMYARKWKTMNYLLFSLPIKILRSVFLFQVVVLDLSKNNFERIPDLSAFKNLEVLNLSHNKIINISRNTFRDFDKLQVLDLSHNRLTEWMDIHREALDKMKQLEVLDLSHNTLGAFPEIYNPMKSQSLKVLKVTNCSISNVHSSVLSDLPQLEKLIMSSNDLFNFKAQIKSDTLTTLDLAECKLRHIESAALQQLPSLKQLIISQNYELKIFKCDSETLEVLDASKCSFESVPKGRLPQLVSLIMNNNNVRYLSQYNFINMSRLQFLGLKHNAIAKVDKDAFYGLGTIHQIDLSYNTISWLEPRIFNQNFKLFRLDLSRNYLTAVPRFDIESLRVLDLSNCEIRVVGSDCLDLMPSLQELYLSRNVIARLPDYFQSDSLKYLDLSMCRISRLNNLTFAGMPFLRKLDLTGNRLTSNIKVSYFPPNSDIYLEDNPWRCDCNYDQQELYEWLERLNDNMAHRMRCQSPENVEGFTWRSACEDQWTPKPINHAMVWLYAIGAVFVVVFLLCLAISVFRAFGEKERRLRELEERERNEAVERLRRMRRQQLEAMEMENRNAPDPRELQRPPSYTEALLMSTPHGSSASLSGSRQSLSAREGGKKAKVRRKRRREKGESSSVERTDSVEQTEDAELTEPSVPLESAL